MCAKAEEKGGATAAPKTVSAAVVLNDVAIPEAEDDDVSEVGLRWTDDAT